jgi:hypothetical protein
MRPEAGVIADAENIASSEESRKVVRRTCSLTVADDGERRSEHPTPYPIPKKLM